MTPSGLNRAPGKTQPDLHLDFTWNLYWNVVDLVKCEIISIKHNVMKF